MLLKEIIEFKNGKKKPSTKGQIPIYGGNGILDYTDQSNYNGETLIVGRVGAYCGCVYSHYGKCWVSDNAIVGKVKDGNDFYYCYYLLKRLNLNARHVGSGQPLMTQEILNSIEVSPPNYSIQKKIGKIFKSIDDKIELNNKINNNLYELIKAYFNEIFVDDENEKKVKLERIVNIRRGASPRPIQSFLAESGINWLKISDVTGSDSPFIYEIKEKIIEEGKSKSVFVPKGTLVVSNSATPGIPKYIMVDTCVHDGWLVLSDYEDKYRYFLYFLIEKIREKLISLSNGSVFNNLKTDILKEFIITLPNNEQLNKFNSFAISSMQKINSTTRENLELAKLRETLLPKLMNGEIDLDNIDI